MKPVRILVVDDDEYIHSTLSRALRDVPGCTLEFAVDGVDAKRRLRAAESPDNDEVVAFDGIICDVVMPRMDGSSLYEWVVYNYPEVAKKFAFHTSEPARVKGRQVPIIEKCDFRTITQWIERWRNK